MKPSPRADDPAAVLADRLTVVLRRLAQPGGSRDTGDVMARAVQAVLAALQQGHTCARLADIAAAGIAAAGDGAAGQDPAALRSLLLQTGAVQAAPDADDAPADAADGAAVADLPLVLDGCDRLYLQRHFAAERRVCRALRQRLEPAPEPSEQVLAALHTLTRAGGGVDWQAVAVAAAVRNRLCVVTGGPGTGKTTTIRKVVTTLLAAQPDLQIALAAPTGKAAARMGDALRSLSPTGMPMATTLHRLLGYLPLEDTFRHGPHALLPHDLVVVDEASMVDLELMDALLQALRPQARLLLLGDRDQLSSVGVGQVLADLCSTTAPERGVGPALAAFCRQHLDTDVPVDPDPSPFAEVVTALRHNHRFGDDSGIGAFASAMAARQPDAALQALQRGHADLELRRPHDLDALLQQFWPQIESQLDAASPAEALQALTRLRVLCATRHGPFGVAAASARIESMLRQRGRRGDGAFYRGRPLLITANDHQTALWNGDLGVVWPGSDDRMMAWFLGRDGAAREFLPLRLPPHETAWAMTVHKSQGSEFDEVLVLLPDRPSPLLHAPLVYTAITRARRRATVVADADLLAQALRSQPQRASGLADALLRTNRG